jgi:hypothetical protein
MNHYWALQQRLCGTPAALNIWLLIAVISIAVAACGNSGSHQGNPPSTQSFTQVANTSSSIQKCGIVQGPGSLKVPIADSGAEQAENCFWLAFQHCNSATLVYIQGGIDPSLIRTFTIHNEIGKCLISDTKQLRIVANLPSVPETSICAGLIQRPNGLDFYACGKDGDVFVQDL